MRAIASRPARQAISPSSFERGAPAWLPSSERIHLPCRAAVNEPSSERGRLRVARGRTCKRGLPPRGLAVGVANHLLYRAPKCRAGVAPSSGARGLFSPHDIRLDPSGIHILECLQATDGGVDPDVTRLPEDTQLVDLLLHQCRKGTQVVEKGLRDRSPVRFEDRSHKPVDHVDEPVRAHVPRPTAQVHFTYDLIRSVPRLKAEAEESLGREPFLRVTHEMIRLHETATESGVTRPRTAS
jgi:hypothetical protein